MKKEEYVKLCKEIEEDITFVAGKDWNTSRARAYIKAYISSLQIRANELEELLSLENKVHTRVEAALAKARIEKE